MRACSAHPRIAGIAGYRVTIRIGPRVERDRHESLPAALDALERRLRSLGADARREPRSFLGREFEPGQQVAARGELAGRGVRYGVDVRGDGSFAAWTGRWRRRLLAPAAGEDAFATLRRAASARGGGPRGGSTGGG